MASTIKKCRVCGREYEACHTLSITPGVFRWQDVACSQECGSVYLAKINASRGNHNVEKPVLDPENVVEDKPEITVEVIDMEDILSQEEIAIEEDDDEEDDENIFDDEDDEIL